MMATNDDQNERPEVRMSVLDADPVQAIINACKRLQLAKQRGLSGSSMGRVIDEETKQLEEAARRLRPT